MPVTQTGKNLQIAGKVQSALGTPSSGASGFGIRARPSSGLNLTSADIRSGEVRRDGQTTLGRMGSQFVTGEYETELSVGGHDAMIEAALRGTWAAAVTLTEASGSLGAITVGTATITNSGGSWITSGIRAGQIIKLGSYSTAANNDRWVRVVSVTASIITVPAGTFTAGASDAAWSLVIAKHVICASPPTERYFTLEEHWQDIDASKVGVDCKFSGFTLTVNSDNVIVLGFKVAGRDINSESAGTTPWFTSPVYGTGQPLILLDGSLRVGGVDRVDATGFSLAFDSGGAGQAVLGSRLSPDVYLSNAAGSGSISGLIDDLAEFDTFKAETAIELFLLASENKADPKDFVSIYAGRAAYRGHQAPYGAEGAMIETMPLVFGVDERGSGFYPSMLVVSTSAA